MMNTGMNKYHTLGFSIGLLTKLIIYIRDNIMRKKFMLTIGLITLIVVQVNAQSISINHQLNNSNESVVKAQNISFGPQIGFYKAHDADEWSYMGGATCRLKFMTVLGIEASINYRQEKYADGALTVRSWPVMLTGLVYILPVVYGAIGAGWYNTTFDYDQNKLPFLKDETAQKVGWHFGAGVELPVGTNFKLTGDIRYVFLDYDFEEIPGSNDLKSNFTIITFGLLFSK